MVTAITMHDAAALGAKATRDGQPLSPPVTFILKCEIEVLTSGEVRGAYQASFRYLQPGHPDLQSAVLDAAPQGQRLRPGQHRWCSASDRRSMA